jgi:hypothetical protein
MASTLQDLATNWLNKTWPYRPSAFWFWNADMNPQEMETNIIEMANAGIREFLIHPIHGLEIEYLSDVFFDRYRHALRLAKAHNMKVWVYDEFGWPSGVAGGKLLREHPEHRGWFLSFSRNADGKITAEPRQCDRVLDNTMGAPWTRSETGYLDTLSTDAVQCYIDMVYERTYRECGDLFKEVIAGFFTDEPASQIADKSHEGVWTAYTLPWTPTFPERFKKRFGYEIEPHYSELAGDGPSSIKRDYWALAKEMHIEAYHAQLGQWCRDHSVKYTGHVGEDMPLQQIRFAGSVFQALSQMDIPGVDFLCCNPEANQRFVDQVAVSSIARHTGKEHVYCEVYGISRFDLRLAEMLRTAQILGINGVDDLALMGFHQSLSGMRKHLYWPPIFQQSPWWSFYNEFRDTFARSIGLTASGKRRARYAILYPQNQLEQTDLFFTEIWTNKDPGSKMIYHLGQAIYEAGETFEFVFPEILDQAKVKNGRIHFDHADYDAILAPGDVAFFDESVAVLNTLTAAGGKVLREPTDTLAATIKKTPASWTDRLQITGRTPDLRVYRFEFADGELFALRNAGKTSPSITISSSLNLTQWDPTQNAPVDSGHEIKWTVLPDTCRFFTLSEKPITNRALEEKTTSIALESKWQVSTDRPNLTRLQSLQFEHEGRWLNAVASRVAADVTPHYQIGLPDELHGQTRIPFQAQFTADTLPDSLNVLFERNYLESLSINNQPIDLSKTQSILLWDSSCCFVDIRSASRTGVNQITGVLKFQQYETSTSNDAFFANAPMPACNVYIAGSFRTDHCRIIPLAHNPMPLPIDLSTAGWQQYHGIATLRSTVMIDETLAKRIKGMELNLVGEDAIEVILDGVSLGKRIITPYRFNIENLTPGQHQLEVKISGTSGNALHEPSPWGLAAIHWLCQS